MIHSEDHACNCCATSAFLVRYLPSWTDSKVGATLAVIGIIVAEFFGGTANALGILVANSAALSQFTLTWAAVLAASILGLVAYGIVLLMAKIFVPWQKSI